MWEIQKHKLYDSGSGPVQQLHFQSSPGDLVVAEGQRNGKFSPNGKFGQNDKLDHSFVRVTTCRLYDSPGQKSCYCAFRFKCKQLRP